MGKKAVYVGKFVEYEDKQSERESSGKKFPDSLVIKMKGKLVKIGCFKGKPKILDDLELGTDIKVPVYIDVKNDKEWINLGFDPIEIVGAGKSKEKEPEEDPSEGIEEPEEEPEEAVEEIEKPMKSQKTAVDYRNYRIEEFVKCYQDARLTYSEMTKMNEKLPGIDGLESMNTVITITKAFFKKSCLNEKDFNRSG